LARRIPGATRSFRAASASWSRRTPPRREGIRGIRPRIFHPSLPLSIVDHKVHPDFRFVQSRSLATGYVGYFKKSARLQGAASPALEVRREGGSPAAAEAVLAQRAVR